MPTDHPSELISDVECFQDGREGRRDLFADSADDADYIENDSDCGMIGIVKAGEDEEEDFLSADGADGRRFLGKLINMFGKYGKIVRSRMARMMEFSGWKNRNVREIRENHANPKIL